MNKAGNIKLNQMLYERASKSECPNNKCEDCSNFIALNGKTLCYFYEQQKPKDNSVFNPGRDFNCTFFEKKPGVCHLSIEAYKEALAKGIDPQKDPDYQEALKIDNDTQVLLSS